MTVPTETSSVVYAGTGSTHIFAYTWQIVQDADLEVWLNVISTGVLTKLTLTTDYTVTGAGVFAGGTVVLGGGNLPSGTSIFIASDPSEVQLTLFAQNAPTDPAAIMAALDLLTREVQALRRRVDNSIQIPVAESLDGTTTILPAAPDRISQAVVTDASGNITLAPISDIAIPNASFITSTDEGADLPASRQLVDGDGTVVNDGGAGSTLAIDVPQISAINSKLDTAPFLMATTDPDFGSSRQVLAGLGLNIVDGGAGANLTIEMPTFTTMTSDIAANASAIAGVTTAYQSADTTIKAQTYLTVSNDSATLPNSRHAAAGTGIQLTDGGAASTMTIGLTPLATFKLPIILETASGTYSEMQYDVTTDSYIAVGASTASKISGASLAILSTLSSGLTGCANLCIIPSLGKAFIGCSSQKLSILDIATMTLDVSLLQQQHNYGAGLVNVDVVTTVIFNPTEDVVYGFGQSGSGNQHLSTFNKTTGVLISTFTVWNGSGAGGLPSVDGSMDYNPANGDIYYFDQSQRLTRIAHSGHAVTTQDYSGISNYSSSGCMKFDNSGNLYLFCGNASPAKLQKCDLNGNIVATLTVTNFTGGSPYMVYDSTRNLMYVMVASSRILVVDLVNFVALGSAVFVGASHYNGTIDVVRSRLAVAYNASGYGLFQM
jgi:hypothetical protein